MIRVLLWAPNAGGPLLEGTKSEFHVTVVRSVPELLLFARNSLCDVVVLDTEGSAAETDDVLLEVRRASPRLPVLVCAQEGTTEDAMRLVRLGAFHVLTSETRDAQRLSDLIRTAVESSPVSSSVRDEPLEPWRRNLVGSSQPVARVVDIIRLVAARRSTVLITGETGTGKEVVARAIHAAGGRENLPFVAVNCSAIPESLMESELFGYVKGAFTGALQTRAGKFEQAQGGTIFLDEIGELQPEMQAKLLRVLQEREVQRIGGSETVKLNVRVIAATNLNLQEEVRRKRFREDLFYRLNVVPLHLPALRERPGDIPALVEFFLERVCRAEGVEKRGVSPRALNLLVSSAWPGNIRQLEHAIEMAVVLSGERRVLDVSDFPNLFSGGDEVSAESGFGPVLVPDEGLDYEETVSRFERSILQQALVRCNGNKARAAQLLRMKRTTLLARIKSLECEAVAACA